MRRTHRRTIRRRREPQGKAGAKAPQNKEAEALLPALNNMLRFSARKTRFRPPINVLLQGDYLPFTNLLTFVVRPSSTMRM